jgi:serine protease Do
MDFLKYKRLFLGLGILISLILIGGGVVLFLQYRDSVMQNMAKLQTEVKMLQDQVVKISGENSEFATSIKSIQTAPQGNSLTTAVKKITPSVVSIVVSKDVPNLEIGYETPFPDDPGFRIPVYRQRGTTKKEVGAGSGFIITPNGYILTNKHVVADTNASYTVLLSDGRELDAKVVYRDQNKDVAVVKVSGSGFTPAVVGNSSSVELGQTVIAVGNALGEYSNSVSTGIISGLNRTIEAEDQSGNAERITGTFQTDAAINPGNSGGPLVDSLGKVIGINVATVVGSNSISFAIPIDTVKPIISSL